MCRFVKDGTAVFTNESSGNTTIMLCGNTNTASRRTTMMSDDDPDYACNVHGMVAPRAKRARRCKYVAFACND